MLLRRMIYFLFPFPLHGKRFMACFYILFFAKEFRYSELIYEMVVVGLMALFTDVYLPRKNNLLLLRGGNTGLSMGEAWLSRLRRG